MANHEADRDNALTKVARTVGSALGTVASRLTDGVAEKSDAAPSAPPTKPRKNDVAAKVKAAGSLEQRAQQQKKAKRDKHKRKLQRKTAG